MRGTLFLVFSLLFFFLIMNSTIEDSSFPQTQDDIFNLAGALSPGEQVKELIVVWMNERNSPEMLPYRNDLVDSLTKAVEHQASCFSSSPFITYTCCCSLKKFLSKWKSIQIRSLVLFK